MSHVARTISNQGPEGEATTASLHHNRMVGMSVVAHDGNDPAVHFVPPQYPSQSSVR